MKKRVFSGIQPSGVVHLGNYIGALKNWVSMQETHDCLYCIVDLHAITVPQDPRELKESILRTAATTLAVGIDPQKSILFVQSDVPQHAELAWLLSCFVYFGELNQMTQFKDKSRVRGQGTSTGLFTYPVLMTSDILLYDAHAVPVGDDQRQHLELARLTARRVNKQFNDLFIVPEPFIGEQGARVMGLDDPSAKMSKSAASSYNYVAFTDSPDLIRKKFKKAVTDSGTNITYEPDKRPGLANLLNIYSALTNEPMGKILAKYEGKGFGPLKGDLGDIVVEAVTPIQTEIDKLMNDPSHIHALLKEGAEKAEALAKPKIDEFKKRIGLGL